MGSIRFSRSALRRSAVCVSKFFGLIFSRKKPLVQLHYNEQSCKQSMVDHLTQITKPHAVTLVAQKALLVLR